MLGDLRYAFLSITRSRGLTAVLLLSLALGTGTNASVCGAVYALLAGTPAGVDDGAGLIDIYTRMSSGGPHGPTSYPDFREIAGLQSLESIAAADDRQTMHVRLKSTDRTARVGSVSSRFFATLGLRAHTGRLLDEGDAVRWPRPAVISHRLWIEIGSPAEIIGAPLILGRDAEFTVVGVAPPRFLGLRSGRPVDVWTPLPPDESDDARGRRTLGIVARLAAGATVRGVNRELETLSAALAERHPRTNRGTVLDPGAPRRIFARRYSPLDPDARGHAHAVGAIVMATVGLLLVSSCVNAGSLLLARSAARRRELAVKLALGATTRRLVRQLVLESVLVCLAGAALGVLFAVWTADVLPVLFAPEHAALLDTTPDAALMLVTIGIAVGSGVAFALLPARHDVKAPTVAMLRGDAGDVSNTPGGSRVRGALVCAQVGASTLLLATAGLLVTGLGRALEAETAVPIDRVAVLTVERRNLLYQPALIQKVQELPNVASVGWTTSLPLGRASLRQFQLNVDGLGRDAVEFQASVISGGYFAALGLLLREGRLFDDRDWARSKPVVIVDEDLARQYFGTHAAGRVLLDENGRALEIVGVVSSTRYRTLQPAAAPTVYFPLNQQFVARGHLVVHLADDAARVLPWLTGRLRTLDPRLEISRPQPLRRHLQHALVLDRLITALVGACGLLALAMSVIGVYGVMSDAVQRRTREIGLRVALGAQRLQVVRLVLADTAIVAPAGLVLGMAGAAAVSRIGPAFVYRLPSMDLAMLAAATAGLAFVVALASVIPLRRALAVSPMVALRGN